MILAITISLILACVLGSEAQTPKGSMKINFTVKKPKNDLANNILLGRDDKYASIDVNEKTYYMCEVHVGSNRQPVTLKLETDTSFFWVMAPDVKCYSYPKRDFSLFKREVSDKTANRVRSNKLAKRDEIQYTSFQTIPWSVTTLPESWTTYLYGTSWSLSYSYWSYLSYSASWTTRTSWRTSSWRTTYLGASTRYGTQYSTIYSTTRYGTTRYGTQYATDYTTRTKPTATYGPIVSSCTQYGTFATGQSDTWWKNESSYYFLSSPDGDFVYGVEGTDRVEFNGYNLTDVGMGVVNSTNYHQGTLGLGLSEGQYNDQETVLMRLKSQGIINKQIYSLYMNEKGSTGSVLFGAVDHAKYDGSLQTIPLINLKPSYFDKPGHFHVVLSAISQEGANSNQTITDVHYPALLRSGSPRSYFPSTVLYKIATMLGGEYRAPWYEVSCQYSTRDLNLIFEFSGAKIKVPMSEFILEYAGSCFIDALEADYIDYMILGENFLRSAYVVYDLESYEILLAQAAYSDEENIEVVSLSVPLAVKAPSYSELTYDDQGNPTGLVTQVPISGLLVDSSAWTMDIYTSDFWSPDGVLLYLYLYLYLYLTFPSYDTTRSITWPTDSTTSTRQIASPVLSTSSASTTEFNNGPPLGDGMKSMNLQNPFVFILGLLGLIFIA